MTRLDAGTEVTEAGATTGPGPRALLLAAREVPLGGVRAMQVHRALPQRDLPLVGAWCFLDRFGPQSTTMRVEPHPHIGLQTVTWPLVGEVRHRDTVGSDVVVRRGALNLMTSGAGIAHSEYSLGEGPVPLDALQLWIALPESRRHGAPAFERHEDLPAVVLPADEGADAAAVVVIGAFGAAGSAVASPASAYTPIVGAELRLRAGSRVRVPLRPEWEHALVGVTGAARVTPVLETADAAPGGDGEVLLGAAGARPTGPAAPPAASAATGRDLGTVDRLGLLYLGSRRDAIELQCDEDAVLFLLGGEPFEDDIVMWWNFVGRSHEEIVEAREAWEAGAPRFGHVPGHGSERIPAPPMPAVRLRRRRRP